MKVVATTLSLLLPVLYWLRNGSLSKLTGAVSGKYGVVDGRQPVTGSTGSTQSGLPQNLTDIVGSAGTMNTTTPGCNLLP